MPTNVPFNDPRNSADLSHREAGKLHGRNEEQPGYETTDVNVSGVIVFLAGLSGFLLVFFGLCFVLGRLINNGLEAHDGKVNKWNQMSSFAGAAANGGKRQDLATNPEMQQKALQQMTVTFPEPRLDTDDSSQRTADLHAREDLLLNFYSTVPGQPNVVRIPVDQAMQLIAKRGLPQAVSPASAAAGTEMAGVDKPQVQVPLTTGFARTGWELDAIEARAQKMNYGKAEGAEHAQLKEIR